MEWCLIPGCGRALGVVLLVVAFDIFFGTNGTHALPYIMHLHYYKGAQVGIVENIRESDLVVSCSSLHFLHEAE